MHFRHPEILYFLGLLIIPILVHLFQLQKFQKTTFTNVAFLQKIVLQTRRSSQLKKWLILATRLLLFSALIFAFSQPYFSHQKSVKKAHYNFYIDNSLSTNTAGEKGDLLQVTAQEIINNIAEDETYSLLTNSHFYKNITGLEFKNILISIQNTPKSKEINDVFLQFESEFSNKTKTLHKNILISDFQYNKLKKINEFTNVKQPYSLIKLTPSIQNNLSVDSVFISEKTNTGFTINTVVKNQGDKKETVPIAVFNNQKLVGKRSFSIGKNSKKNIVFKIENSGVFLGEIQLNFKDTYAFDNRFFFVQNSTEKINVLAIGKTTSFLKKIFTKKEFIFTESAAKNIAYNAIPKQQLVILNELVAIPPTLLNSLDEFVKDGGHLIIIPNENSLLTSYNQLLRNFQSGQIIEKSNNALKITAIKEQHPVFNSVFSKKVQNFQYPTVNSSYTSTLKGNTILAFENEKPFVSSFGNIYWFASVLNKENSNFINSPLVVPLFYNIGQKSFKNTAPYYNIDKKNNIDVAVKLSKNDILSIANTQTSFIPLQQSYQNKTSITTGEEILKAGFYTILNKKDSLKTIAFNYNTSESLLDFMSIKELAAKKKTIETSKNIEDFFTKQNKKNKVHWLWKWFLGLAIVSLLFEILILKFFKE